MLLRCYVFEDGVEDNASFPWSQRAVQAGGLCASRGDVCRCLRARRHRRRPIHRRLSSSSDARMDTSQDASACRCILAGISHLRSATVGCLR